jgi:phenylacetate-CoA ligase
MSKITGRSDDMIILRGVNVFPTQIEEQILKCRGLVPHFHIELTREGRMDAMTVHVEATPQAADTAQYPNLSTELAHHIKSIVGVTAHIQIHAPSTLPRSEGKARRVIDNRPKD